MGLFDKKPTDRLERDSLIDEIYGKLSEQEIAELEQDAERREAFEAMRRQIRRARNIRVLVTVFILVSLTLAVAFAGYRFLFVISEIKVVGDVPYTAEEICEAAEISEGDRLYSFSSGNAEERLITTLPYIASLEVDRHIPNRITLTVTREKAVYYTEIYGKIYLMSDTLRILGEAGEGETEGLIWLRLTSVKEARAGYLPALRDTTAQKYLQSVTETAADSVLADRITQIDMRSIYELKMVCDDKYLLEMGDYTETATKLRIADAVLADEMFDNENKARLDLSKLSETAVIVNNKLDFTE